MGFCRETLRDLLIFHDLFYCNLQPSPGPSERSQRVGGHCTWAAFACDTVGELSNRSLSWKTKFLALLGRKSNLNLKFQACAMQKGFKILTCHNQLWLEAELLAAPGYRALLLGSFLCPVLRGALHPIGDTREKVEGLPSSLLCPGARLGAAVSLLHCSCRQALVCSMAGCAGRGQRCGMAQGT